jgi:hypothetical protein
VTTEEGWHGNKINFLNEKDGPDESDERDLLTGSGGEDGWGGAVTGPYSSPIASYKRMYPLFC